MEIAKLSNGDEVKWVMRYRENEADIDLIADKAREQEELLKLVCEVRAKNGMTPSRMNRVLERLDKTNMMPQWS